MAATVPHTAWIVSMDDLPQQRHLRGGYPRATTLPTMGMDALSVGAEHGAARLRRLALQEPTTD
jgi:hypothetical protein